MAFIPYKIDGVVVATPSKASYNLVPIVSDENRLEDATLVLRAVTNKYKTVWSYDYIVGSSLIAILGESWEKYVSNKKYSFGISMPSYGNGSITFNAYFKEFNFNLIVNNENPNLRVYSDFSITWIEY